MNHPRILTLFLRTGTASYAEAEPHLDALFARQLPGVHRHTVVVDNALPPGLAESDTGREVIGGDNRVSEFSAIDAALAHVGGRVWDFDLVNIVTSAFEQLYVAYLDRFTVPVVSAAAAARACIGHIDCYNEEIGVLAYRSQHWLRTSFIMLPPRELMLLGSAVSVRDATAWFSGDPDAPFTADAPLDDTYRRYIVDWLLGRDIGQGVRWHKTLELAGEGRAIFERKALAILNEHLLGIRLRAAGCHTVDVTWLSAVLAAGRTPEWSTPWWRQLEERDRDARVVTRPEVRMVMHDEEPEPPASAPAGVDGQPEHDTNAAYDRETIDVMARVLAADGICLDIGAHEGSVLHEMVRLAPQARHHAFEPLPHLAARLRDAYPHATIHEAAVSDAPGTAEYVFVENAPAYSGLRERQYDRPDPIKTVLPVSVVRIDDVVPDSETVSFIKLDIEGGEYHALRGAARTITRCRPVVVFEASVRSTGQYGVTPEDMYGMLNRDYGFEVSTMRRWLSGRPPMSADEFASNWHGGPDYYFIAYPG
ncbi:MAG: FkbM family methyltransferase [Vicinamibacterales bacterium]